MPGCSGQLTVISAREIAIGILCSTADIAACFAIYLDITALNRMTEVQPVNRVEASPGPLVRYWRWPAGAKSAMCVTGDLDALTLLDQISRLTAR